MSTSPSFIRLLPTPGRAICAGVLCLYATGAILTGCATSTELVQKSDGYYQEGIASLPTDRQKAFVSFQKSIQMNPENKDAHYALGVFPNVQGKLADAEKSFRSAIAIDGAYSEAHNYLGQVLVSENRWEDAIKAYRQALSNPLYATPDKARFNLGLALVHEGKLQLAMEMFEDPLTVNPPNVPPAQSNLELGKVCYKLGYHTRAREVLTKVATMEKGGELAQAAAELLAQLK